jgi:anthranilate/para-aminobenzoate synthase component I
MVSVSPPSVTTTDIVGELLHATAAKNPRRSKRDTRVCLAWYGGGVRRLVRLSPDPIALARALAPRSGLAVLASSVVGALRDDDVRESFVACEPVETSDDLVPPRAGFWIGAVPYEALRAIERRGDDTRPSPRIERPRWKRYDAVLCVDHRTGDVMIEADDLAASERLLRATRAKPVERRDVHLRPLDGEPRARHPKRVAAALDYIARGDVYQVNLARRLDFAFDGAPLDLLARTPAPYAALVELDDDLTIVSASPELALELRGDRLRTCPIKGTRPRGTCRETDETERADLEASEKERAELVMATDLHRNDLGRVARFGSVRVLGEPHTLMSPTVFSRVQEIVASRADGVDLSRVVSAVLPCGSVTGAPKVRAMEIIAELEAHRRGLYTGAIGFVHRGRCVLSMAIRTAVVSRRERALEYFAGGGIVAGSDPARELDETNWKAAHLVGKGT